MDKKQQRSIEREAIVRYIRKEAESFWDDHRDQFAEGLIQEIDEAMLNPESKLLKRIADAIEQKKHLAYSPEGSWRYRKTT